MSETRKNHLNIDGGQAKEDDNVASYKPIPESDTAQEIQYIEASGDTEYMELNQMEAMESDVVDESVDHWDHNSVKLMLSHYIKNLDKFRNPKIKNKTIWEDIAHRVGRSPETCDKKFRNLKMTYLRLLKKKRKNPSAPDKWPYFEMFDEIYCVNGEYLPEIQQKIQDTSTENVAKVLLSIQNPSTFESEQVNGESSTSVGEDARSKLNKKRYSEFRKVTLEMRDRQRVVEEKLDKLINIVEESNRIQRERNRLFEQFLEKLNNTS